MLDGAGEGSIVLPELVIQTNAPGELSTWVYPVLREVEAQGVAARISVLLQPCEHAGGEEAALARSLPGVARVLPAAAFWPALLRGKFPEGWDWGPRGVVVFLGGDPTWTVGWGWRLGYPVVVYAEERVQRYRGVAQILTRTPAVAAGVPPSHRAKVQTIGDLMVSQPLLPATTRENLVLFLPGSKPGKLQQGVPLCLAIADLLQQRDPDVQLAIALAPTVTPAALARYATAQNPALPLVYGTTAELVGDRLITPQGTAVRLQRTFPAGELWQRAQIAVTTVGANTAELAALGVPFVVLLPSNQLDAMRTWPGLPGLLARLPGVGSAIARLVNWVAFRRLGLLAWPNIWAGEEVVPELRGHLTPQQVADTVDRLRQDSGALQTLRQRLIQLAGDRQAAQRLVAYLRPMLEADPNEVLA